MPKKARRFAMTPTNAKPSPSFFIPNTDTFEKALAIIIREPTPWFLALLFLTHLAAFFRVPRFTSTPHHWVLALIAIGLILFIKLSLEWFIHGNVQHVPRGVLKWTSLILPRGPRRSHGAHHANPSDLSELFFPLRSMPAAVLADWAVFGWLWFLSPRVALAAITYAIGKAWWIDVVHFTLHTEWQPTGAYGWLIAGCRPHHGLHHGYGRQFGFSMKGGPSMWLEITSRLAIADRLFGTTHLPPWWKRLATYGWPWKWNWSRWWEAWSHVNITWW